MKPDLPVCSNFFTFFQLVELTGANASLIGELIDIGWIEPEPTQGAQLLFHFNDAYRLRKLVRIVDDFELTPAAGSIIVDLVGRIERLENTINELRRALDFHNFSS